MLAALRSSIYRRFWTGSLVANIGVWVQQVALGWLVYDLTHAATWLGAISFAGNAPMLVLGLLGGAIADRANPRILMVGAMVVMAITAATLSLLTALGRITIPRIIALAIVSGTASALYTPTMHSVIPGLVAPEQLLGAISLNSVQFNLARTLGPALAGGLYPIIGAAGCFATNAVGFLVLTLVLMRLRFPSRAAVVALPLAAALREGLGYARRHPVIGPALLLAIAASLFGFPYIIMLPALARGTLGLGPSGLALLTACVGGGAVMGGLLLSFTGALMRPGRAALGAAGGLGGALMLFAAVRGVWATAALLALLGMLHTTCAASLTTTLQLAVDDGMRGRIMSMVSVVFFGVSTAGGVLVGALADRLGVPDALAVGGFLIVGSSAVVFVRAPGLGRPLVTAR